MALSPTQVPSAINSIVPEELLQLPAYFYGFAHAQDTHGDREQVLLALTPTCLYICTVGGEVVRPVALNTVEKLILTDGNLGVKIPDSNDLWLIFDDAELFCEIVNSLNQCTTEVHNLTSFDIGSFTEYLRLTPRHSFAPRLPDKVSPLLEFSLRATQIKKKILRNSDPYVEVFLPPEAFVSVGSIQRKKEERRLACGGTASPGWKLVYRSEYLKKNQNPNWRPFTLSPFQLQGDLNTRIHFDVYDYSKSGTHVFIGSCECPVASLISSGEISLPMINPAKQVKKGKQYTNSGILYAMCMQQHLAPTIATPPGETAQSFNPPATTSPVDGPQPAHPPATAPVGAPQTFNPPSTTSPVGASQPVHPPTAPVGAPQTFATAPQSFNPPSTTSPVNGTQPVHPPATAPVVAPQSFATAPQTFNPPSTTSPVDAPQPARASTTAPVDAPQKVHTA